VKRIAASIGRTPTQVLLRWRSRVADSIRGLADASVRAHGRRPSSNDPDPVKAAAYLHGGATIWQNPTIDPELGLIYFSTGNAGPDYDGSVRPGDNLFAVSIVALHMDGSYAWHFQQVHHDIWDFDSPSPTVLYDTTIKGQPVKATAAYFASASCPYRHSIIVSTAFLVAA
jgi:glucose dehydrogenase